MRKGKLSLHEKAIQRIKQRADQHINKFRKMELDLKEAVEDLNGVVNAIDAEMDKLATLRISTQQQIKGHQTVLTNVGNMLGGFERA